MQKHKESSVSKDMRVRIRKLRHRLKRAKSIKNKAFQKWVAATERELGEAERAFQRRTGLDAQRDAEHLQKRIRNWERGLADVKALERKQRGASAKDFENHLK